MINCIGDVKLMVNSRCIVLIDTVLVKLLIRLISKFVRIGILYGTSKRLPKLKISCGVYVETVCRQDLDCWIRGLIVLLLVSAAVIMRRILIISFFSVQKVSSVGKEWVFG